MAGKTTERRGAEEQFPDQIRPLQQMKDAVVATDLEFVVMAWNLGAERIFGWTATEAMGRRICELIQGPFGDGESWGELRSLAEDRSWHGTWYGKNDHSVTAESANITLRSAAGDATGYVCIIHDQTEWLRAQKSLAVRARQQALLGELTLRILDDGDLQALLDDAAALVGRTLELKLVAVGESMPDGAGVVWRAAFGCGETAIADARASPADARSLAGYALLVDEPVISEDVRADGRFEISDTFARQNPGSGVAVVIPGERRPFGVLVAAAGDRRRFRSEDVDFTAAVANVIGTAVERARIAERIEEVRESLRLRIARDLHDDALRELSDALALALVARSAATRQDDASRWDDLLGALQRVGEHLRGAVYDLRLTAEQDRSFADLLSELVAIQAGKAGACPLFLTGGPAVPTRSLGRPGTEVLRIVREALTNARLHSGATMIEVDAGASTTAALRLVVEDDGGWPDRDRWRSTGRNAGIAGMIERADALGAKLRIGRRPGGGTRVAFELSLDSDRAG